MIFKFLSRWCKHFQGKSDENLYQTKIHTIIPGFFFVFAAAAIGKHYLNYLQPNLHVGLIIYITTIRTCLKVENDQTFSVDKVGIAIIHFTILFTIGQC